MKHTLWMVIGCLGCILLLALLGSFFSLKYGTLIALALCLGMHFFMMRGMHSDEGDEKNKSCH